MAKTPEGRVKDKIREWLEKQGFWRAGATRPAGVTGWYFTPVNNGMGVAGIPDFLCCYQGQFFGIEAKAPKGEPTENQLERHREIRIAGGTVVVISDVTQLEGVLEEMLKGG